MNSRWIERRMRRALRKLGVDVHRYPSGDGIARCVSLMNSSGVDLVVDVGASDGGFARDLFDRGYEGRLISFEPLANPFRELLHQTKKYSGWQAVNAAVGESGGNVAIHVAGNNGESSSLLPMMERHRIAAPETSYVGIEECRMVRLDEFLLSMFRDEVPRFFLKVDVQGREEQVFEGCVGLPENLICGLQVEMSFEPLYEGSTEWSSVMTYAKGLGLDLVFLRPGFSDQDGWLLQADAFFFRRIK